MSSKTVFSFRDPNTGELMQKQYDFFTEVMRAARRESDNRIFHFGGGIRGGKTFTCLFTLLQLAKEFPGIKIHIVRDSMPNVKRTVLESLMKLCRGYKNFYQGSDNPHIEFHNGSRIFLLSENYDADKDLDRFKGLETNVFFLEQLEELREKTFNKAIERVGTELFEGMPPGLILTTFNPTRVKWIREMIYKPYKIGKSPDGHYTVMATAADNPHIPDDLRKNWTLMNSVDYKVYVEGDWEAEEGNKLFCFSFDERKHIKRVVKKSGADVYISFDFNVDPAVCLLAYVGDNYLQIFKEFRIRNSNVFDLCQGILDERISGDIYMTGDRNGDNRSHSLQDNITTYDIIRKTLGITKHNTHVPKANLGLRDSRRVCNTVLERYNVEIDPSCEFLIEDLMTVEANDKGGVEKSKDPLKSHLLDCFRYYCNVYFTKQVLGTTFKFD